MPDDELLDDVENIFDDLLEVDLFEELADDKLFDDAKTFDDLPDMELFEDLWEYKVKEVNSKLEDDPATKLDCLLAYLIKQKTKK